MERYHVIDGYLRLDQGGTVTSYADAQATIAALQARVQELEEHKQDAIHYLRRALQEAEIPVAAEGEIAVSKVKDLVRKVNSLTDQLTQRTAERDTARRRVDELESREVDVVMLREDLEQRTAELEAAQREACLQREVEAALSSKVAEYEVELNGDPQNFYGRGRTVGLRTLILALPKVEGEIRVGKTVDDCWFIDNQDAGGLCGRYKDDGPKYAALLQHRQGMEG